MELYNNEGSVSTVHQTSLDGLNYAVTKASKAFKKGDQIFENYGQPNHIYFLYHGFTLGENNTRDCARLGNIGITANDEGAKNTIDTRTRLAKIGFTSMNPSFCIRDAPSLDKVAQFLRIKHGMGSNDDIIGLASDIIPHLTQILRDRIRRYTATKRSTFCDDATLPTAVKQMLQIVDREQIYLEDALNIVMAHEHD